MRQGNGLERDFLVILTRSIGNAQRFTTKLDEESRESGKEGADAQLNPETDWCISTATDEIRKKESDFAIYSSGG